MQPRHRFHASLLLAALGALLAWLLATPLALAIPVGVGGLLLARQYQFLRDLQHAKHALTVTQSLADRQRRTHQPTTLTIDTTPSRRLPIEFELTPKLPAALTTATDDPITITESTDPQTYILESDIAGRYEIPAPVLTATSRDDRFQIPFQLGNAVSLAVTPASPREIHVGEGGERFAAAYGEHPAARGGAGLDPSELRQYLPGDPTNRIDWKATARLNEPHVREFEAETDRETRLIIDTRPAMATGPPGETKLDYARQLALAFVDSASHLSDPLGLITFDDTGITTTLPPQATPTHYQSLRTHLHDLTPSPTPDTTTPDRRGPDTAYRDANRLTGDDSPFATHLRPFLAARDRYVERLGDRPLFTTVHRQLTTTSGRVWTILITDDTTPVETRESVKLACRQSGHVLVCLLPSILYEPGGLSDLDDAYTRYRAFEASRRQLANITGVRALEVGPQDRLAAILAHHQPPDRRPA